MPADLPPIDVVIPTYNEFDVLKRTVDSVIEDGGEAARILIVNAGERLPPDIARFVEELPVPSDHFWTASVEMGFAHLRPRNPRWVMMLNADTDLLPGTLRALYEVASAYPNVVAVAPAYIREPDGTVRLLYSDQDQMGFLLYGRLRRPWTSPEDAPSEPFEIALAGGQGMLLRGEWISRYPLDVPRFPQDGGDHDLWLRMRRDGIRLLCVPKAGVVNQRLLGAHEHVTARARLNRIWWRMTSDRTAESLRVIWRLRRKHLGLPLALVSTAVTFGVRWTIGLPKILRRL